MQRIRLIGLIALSALLAVPTLAFGKEHSSDYSPAVNELLLGRSLLGRPLTPSELPKAEIFALTPEMKLFAQQVALPSDTGFEKAKKLQVALLSSVEQGGLGIAYSTYDTALPSQTFTLRRANCLSFTLLYVALARHMGLDAQVNAVDVPPEWDLRNQKDMVFFHHVNVKVHLSKYRNSRIGRDDVVVDLQMDNYDPSYPQRDITEAEVAAQFFSNRAMEYLVQKDLLSSFLYIRKAIEVSHQQSYLWSNLGAIYSRKQLWREAELAYLQGLSFNARDITIINNLSYVYRQIGDEKNANKYLQLAQRHRAANPFFQYGLALTAFDRGDYPQALDFIHSAIMRDKKDIRFYQLAANIYERQGRGDKAVDMQNKIKKLKGV